MTPYPELLRLFWIARLNGYLPTLSTTQSGEYVVCVRRINPQPLPRT